jgi:transposase
MIPEAREVHLSRKDRKVLEACCRSPVTLQRDLKRARIVLLAAAGRSTRSIAKEVGVQPRIVSLWRHRYADHGLEGLQDKPRPGKQPIYTKATDNRILNLLDKPAPQGFARWTGPLLAEALGDVDVQYVWRFLRSHKIDLAARKSWCESNDPNFTAKAADVVGLYIAPPAKAIVLCVDEKPSIQALERAQGYLKLPNGRALTGQSHDLYEGCGVNRFLEPVRHKPRHSHTLRGGRLPARPHRSILGMKSPCLAALSSQSPCP